MSGCCGGGRLRRSIFPVGVSGSAVEQRLLLRWRLLRRAEALDPDLIRVDARTLQAFSVLRDAEAAFGEAERILSPERPLLDEAAVHEHEPHRGHEAGGGSPGGGLAGRRIDDPVADPGSAEADRNRQPRGHGIGARHREAGEGADDEGGEHGADDRPDHVRRVAIPAE